VLALDAKMSFDDNALFRRRNIVDMNDPSQSIRARRRRWSTPSTTSGSTAKSLHRQRAGLAMATMDMIKHAAAARRTSSTLAARLGRARRDGLPAGLSDAM